MTTEIQTYQPQQMQVQPQSLFFNISAFMDGQRMASLLASSKLIPANFQGNMPDCLIALELAVRIGVSPMAVMQNMFIIHGRPGYSAQFIIAMVNSCGKFSPLRFDLEGAGDDRSCTAWAFELATGDKLSGTTVSIKMAKAEGWMGKSGSKWQTMPELMLRYRSAAFFGRLYAPELLMGMRTAEELYDEPGKEIPAAVSKTDLNARFATGTANVSTKKQEVIEAEVAEVPEPVGPPPAEVAAPKQSTKRSSQSKATPPPQEPVKPEPVTTLPPVAATAVAELVAELDAMTRWPDVMKWETATANTLKALSDADRGRVMAYSTFVLHRLQVDECNTVQDINDWADLKMKGINVQLLEHSPTDGARYFEHLKKHCLNRIAELRATDPVDETPAVPDEHAEYSQASTMTDIERSKQFNDFMAQMESKTNSNALNAWAMATVNTRAQMPDEERDLINERLVGLLAELEMSEAHV